jgi:DNA-directed RNA polymerase subunit N (RpoN/RPB10)
MDSEFPVRCVCGKTIYSLYPTYKIYRENGLTAEDALNKMRIRKWCCRTRFRCHVPNLGEGYPDDPQVINEDSGTGKITPINISKIGGDEVYD